MRTVIRRDGRISVLEHGEEDRCLDPSDPLAVLECFRAVVEFEEGMTAAQLMRALRPWSAVLSQAAWIDFDAWFAAMDRPAVRIAGADAMRLARLEITPVLSLTRMDGRRRKGPVDVDVAWQLGGRLEAPADFGSGRLEDAVSVTFAEPGIIGHLPLVIVTQAAVHDCSDGRGTPSVLRERPEESPDAFTAVPTFFGAVVLGFLDQVSVAGGPDEAAEMRDVVWSRSEEVLEALEAEETGITQD